MQKCPGCAVRALVLLTALYSVSTAAEQYRFNVWTTDDGLPQNIMSGICQSMDGYLWIATLDGLVRFDGVRFTVYDRSNTPGIDSNRFGSLYQSRQGDLWLGTESAGVTRYHLGKFTSYSTSDGVPSGFVRGITGDEAGQIWILSVDRIARWNEETRRFVDVTPEKLRTHYDSFLWENSGFWGQDEKGLHCFVKGNFVTYELPAALRGRSIWGAALGRDGSIWLETNDGMQARTYDGKVLVINPDSSRESAGASYLEPAATPLTVHVGHRLSRFIEYTSSGRSEKIAFHQMLEDREGNLWLGTEGQGLYRQQRQAVEVYSQEQGLIARNVYPIFQDHSGAIWLGVWPRGLSRFDNGKFTSYSLAEGLPSLLVTALGEDRDGRIWVGTHHGLAIFKNGRFEKPPGPDLPERALVEAICQDRSGALWFGTSRSLVRYQNGQSTTFTRENGLASEGVNTIVEGPAGDLWFGGYGGVTRLSEGRFTRWTDHDGLPSSNVRAIYLDRDGVVWIGTYDGGLARLKDGKLTRYTVSDGLFNNGVFQILEDRRGNFWMSSNRGIYRVSKRELDDFAAGALKAVNSVGYGKVDGMLNAECNGGLWPAGIRARDGKLWFPTQDGVAIVDPDAVPINHHPPPVMIESVLLDRKPVALNAPLRITPDKENWEIQYTALSFINSAQIRFKYKLEALDSDWIDAGLRRTAYYSHVPPGKYVFRVIASNSDGVWNNDGRSLELEALAPFYEQRWFQALVLVLILSLAMAGWRYRMAQVERAQALQRSFSQRLIASQENERKRIAAELHDTLGQRLVIVKGLAALFLRGQRESGANNGKFKEIEEISTEAALAIQESREISYNLRPFQLDRLGLTRALEGMIRSVSKASGVQIQAEIQNIDDALPEELRINFYRIVQESLNNIMKHAQATEASVGVQRSGERIVLTIRDNGRGFAPGTRSAAQGINGFGLTGMAERARLLGGEWKLHSTPGRGTIVTVDIHLQNNVSG